MPLLSFEGRNPFLAQSAADRVGYVARWRTSGQGF